MSLKVGTLKCAALAILGPPGLRQPKNSKRAHLRVATFKHQHTTSKRRRKNENSGGRREICEILALTIDWIFDLHAGPHTSWP